MLEAKVKFIDFNSKINEIEYECEIKIKQLKYWHDKEFNTLRQEKEADKKKLSSELD
jgi:hypothetical protein